MKLQTEIKPRRDGTVIVDGVNGKKYVFVADEVSGDLVCDVDDAAAAALLAGGLFFPADPADYDAAIVLSSDQGDDEGDDDGDDEGEEAVGGLPVEADTPPKPRKPGRPKKAPAA